MDIRLVDLKSRPATAKEIAEAIRQNPNSCPADAAIVLDKRNGSYAFVPWEASYEKKLASNFEVLEQT